eukprot:jgi/Botrbrau1/15604/Bobra.0264s0004.1
MAEMVVEVRQLVAAERSSLEAADTIAAAQEAVEGGNSLLARIVAHFQHLFSCPSLPSVLPAINQVYIANTEAANFKRGLRQILGLEASASWTACMERIQNVLDRHGQLGNEHDGRIRAFREQMGRDDTSAARPSGKENWPQVEILVPGGKYLPDSQQGQQKDSGPAVQKDVPRAHDTPTFAAEDGPPQAEEAVIASLKELFKAKTLAEVQQEAGRVVERLRRLDVVLPKYRQAASQLFELLKVRALEEVVPAVERLLQPPDRCAS